MNRMATETGKDILYINTDGRTAPEITDEVLARIDWLQPRNRTEIL